MQLTRSLSILFVSALLASPAAAAKKCPSDSVAVGTACVDRYEASVWEIPATSTSLIKRILKSKIASASDLTSAGAVQRGTSGDDYGTACPDTAEGCTTMYAVSVPGVLPSRFLNWFQANEACLNAGKRLVTNAEWQGAATGTPDSATDDGSTECNKNSALTVVNTGSRSACVSTRGAYDMIGNAVEMVADWGEIASGSTVWSTAGLTGNASNDLLAFGGDGSTAAEQVPARILRGGTYNVANAGVFYVHTFANVATSDVYSGFRCAR